MTTLTVEIDHKGAAESVRFPAWTTLTAFSIVTLIATVSTASPPDHRSGAEKWAIAVCSLSFVFALVGVASYLFARAVFLGTAFEMGTVGILVVLWGLGLPAIMNPNHGIAVQGTQVSNANVYFFSWGCFAACVYMVASLAQELRGIDVTKTHPKTMKWFVLMACGLIAMGNGTRIFKAGQCGVTIHGPFCRRTKFAISAGVIGFFVSFVMIILARVTAFNILIETVVSLVLLILWCFGVGYITFGIAPGHAIGNLYFASWISFVVGILLFSDCLREYLDARAVATSIDNEDNHNRAEESQSGGFHQKSQAPKMDDLNDLTFAEN